MVTDSRWR